MSSVSKKFKVRGPLLCCIHLIKFESDPYHVFARLESYTILDILGGSYHLLSRLYGYNYPSTTLVISGLYSISFFFFILLITRDITYLVSEMGHQVYIPH